MKVITVGLSPWLQATLTEGFGDPKFKIFLRFRRKGKKQWEKQTWDWLALGFPPFPGPGPSM